MITLKTLPQATAQDVFDQVINHLAQQKERSTEENGLSCLYRHEKPDGTILKCAAGCLISDDEYDSYFEKKRWLNLVKIKMMPEEHQLLIDDLQKAHDCEFTNGRFLAASLAGIAKIHKLHFDINDFLKNFYPDWNEI